MSGKETEIHEMSFKELQSAFQLYNAYEFSDHFHVLTDCRQYGGLLNYVRTGILTMEEAVDVFLRMHV